MTSTLSSPFQLLCCRPSGEELLQQELEARHGIFSNVAASGFIQLEGHDLPAEPLIFEWQRLPNTRFFPLLKGESVPEQLTEAVWTFFAEQPSPWAIHLLTVDDGGASRLEGIARELTRRGNQLHPGLKKWERKPGKLFKQQKGMILQWACTDRGFLFSSSSPTELTATEPGGRTRMKMDSRAPSRSYLKIEEAFVRLGREPEAEQTVIDLGAAPGGWSFAFAKRGCQVTSIDNGPLKIDDACIRRIEHLHRDGLTFQLGKLQPPVDWLVGDMLIPPGKVLGLLRYWVDGHHCKNIVMNVKLPQNNPLPAMEPILEWMKRYPELQVRQFYHDRREVTIFGAVNS
ncbi:SAM-dependent methyltransferase [Kiritimatiellota bacterium B12222]|nr:SAM-dependent methyltransferase [Kiritimatiellota bacterium B12222]